MLAAGTLLTAASLGFSGSFQSGEAVPIRDVVHRDPHRGVTHLRDAALTVEGYTEEPSVTSRLFVKGHHEIFARGKFVVVLYRIENHADQVLDSWPLFFGGCRLLDDQGDAYPLHKVSGQFAKAYDLDMQGTRIGPGTSMRSCVVFDLPKDAVPAKLVLVLDLIEAEVALSPIKEDR